MRGSLGKVDPDPDNYRVTFPLEQDPGKLGARQQQIVGPFEFEFGRQHHPRQHGLIQRRARQPAPAWRAQVRGRSYAQLCEPMKLPKASDHVTALPATAGALAVGQQPIALGIASPARSRAVRSALVDPVSASFSIKSQISARNRAAAALSANAPNQRVRIYPSGEMTTAAINNNVQCAQSLLPPRPCRRARRNTSP